MPPPKRKMSDRSKEIRRRNTIRRCEGIREGFTTLIKHIPHIPKEQTYKMSQIKAIRLAIKYIDHLEKMLDGKCIWEKEIDSSRPLIFNDFKSIATEELNSENSYAKLAEKELTEDVVERIKRRRAGKMQNAETSPREWHQSFFISDLLSSDGTTKLNSTASIAVFGKKAGLLPEFINSA